MKKTYKYGIHSLFLLVLLVLASACSKEEIVFDHELPQFELRDGYQLLEVIMPQSTTVDDQLYIVGEFNGGLEAALADPRWQLEKAANNDAKWGIYLDPTSFVSGKTLADGYYFYSTSQREERSIKNEEVRHTEAPAVGQRINVTVARWAAYFDKPLNPDEVVHDGYAIFVLDNTGWEELTMYAWGDAEAFGGWPGMAPTGKLTIDGVEFTYFDTGEANKGLNLNLIFNNNGAGSQLGDYNVTLDKDYYVEITTDGAVEYDPSNNVVHDGFAIFVANLSTWEELYLYMWGDVNDLNGAWPGMAPTGTQKIKGVEYTYFDLGAANTGLNEHIILNNNAGTQFDDVVVFALDRDVYLELTDAGAIEIDPETYTPGVVTPPEENPDEPIEPEVPAGNYKIFVQDNTGWEALTIYSWGDRELFGGWPGMAHDETAEIGDATYKVWNVLGGATADNLIFNNNNGGTQYDVAGIVINQDYYIVANADAASIVDAPTNDFKIYVEDNTGWDALTIYSWGDREAFGGWPGKAHDEIVEKNGVSYKVWNVTGNATADNLIFNNNNGGTQYDAASVVLYKNYYFTANADGAVLK